MTSSRGPVRGWLRARPADVIDVFVYVVVLNLAIQYVPAVISETFTLSLLTAVLLKVALEVVIWLKGLVVARLRAADTRTAKTGAALLLWVVAAGSKLVVLALVDVVFGDSVSLGGFFSVTLLVLALLVSRGRGPTFRRVAAGCLTPAPERSGLRRARRSTPRRRNGAWRPPGSPAR